ncbi:hypothetical protein Cgig2_003801 [Carnegiea gigantea]|uniref:Uncharacterized protein n=1 Tax=Carnegiea gigantea TaxID=171969 RepID=A0A9Q1QCK8_9CARY|nr:hypothetical protein Cgig2_027724 [Carnegiea gigantea]KAJ8437172.1 hypothetical protein Cgig2_003801 [Carnegiea gigantea]
MSTSAISISRNRLDGKVAIITGGASGIGASTVKLFSEHGAKVVIADIQDDLGLDLVKNIDHPNVCYIHCDVSRETHLMDLIDSTISKYGRLDIMYNNAGIMDGFGASILTSKKEGLDKVLGVNLYGSFFGAKHAARVMLPQKQGCILFTASVCTLIGGIASHPYTMSKYGVLGLAKNLSAELGQHGIRVNCISPSGVFSGMAPGLGGVRGVLMAEDVARAALYLASDDGKFVNGHNLVIDSGSSAVIGQPFHDQGF